MLMLSMTPQYKASVVLGLFTALALQTPVKAGDDGRDVRRLTSAGTPPCPRPLPYKVHTSPELGKLSEKVCESIGDVFQNLEEWGTLTMSGLNLAPPITTTTDGTKVGTFGVDINGKKLGDVNKSYDFHKWMTEAGKTEGTAAFTERIFNSFIASGTLQLAPEQAALADSFLQKQRVEERLFQDQLDRSRLQRSAELEDFQRTRQDRAEARRRQVEAADAAVAQSETALAEAQVVEKQANNRRSQLANAPDYPDKADDVARAQRDVSNAANNVAAWQTKLDQAKADRNTVLLSPVVPAGTELPGTTKPGDNASPPVLKSDFQFQNIITPGSTITHLSDVRANGFATVTPGTIGKSGETNVFGDGANNGDNTLTPTLGSNTDAAFPARARLIDAAGNQTISRIFDFLGNPSAALEFADKPILMAPGTIAVNPGWRTWQDYDGQIDVQVKYSWGPARRVTCERIARSGKVLNSAGEPVFDGKEKDIFNSDEKDVALHFAEWGLWPSAGQRAFRYTERKSCLENYPKDPLAVAVSPLMERQNIDEASSRARQDEIALFLSASLARSGQKAAGDVFNKYMRLRRLDVQTRSALPVVNSYGLGGGRFGFNVTSRLQAIGNVNKPKAQQILEKQNFPILVMFGFASDDLRPKLIYNPETKSAEIWEPRLEIVQAHRWSRQKKRGDLHQVLRSVFLPGYPGRPIDSPAENYKLLNTANYWWEKFDTYMKNNKVKPGAQIQEFIRVAQEDYDFLNQASYGARTVLDIPVQTLVSGKEPVLAAPRQAPEIFSVFLGEPLPDGTGARNLVVVGRHLKGIAPGGITIQPGDLPVTSVGVPDAMGEEQTMRLKVILNGAAATRFQLKIPIPVEKPGELDFLYSPIVTVK